MKQRTIALKRLKSLIEYDPSTGALTWAADKSPALCSPQRRYLCGKIDGTVFLAHRVAWALHHGAWPLGQIDHINGNQADNRIANLRCVTNQQNQFNTGPRGGSSRYKGVYWRSSKKRWVARITIDGKGKHLGYFKSEDDAARAYDDAAVRHHGEYARLNFEAA